jgi:hypothetical protein
MKMKMKVKVRGRVPRDVSAEKAVLGSLYAQDVLELVAKVKAHLGLGCFGSSIRVGRGTTLPGPLSLKKKKRRHIHEPVGEKREEKGHSLKVGGFVVTFGLPMPSLVSCRSIPSVFGWFRSSSSSAVDTEEADVVCGFSVSPSAVVGLASPVDFRLRFADLACRSASNA